jgi:hypothetical protein
LWFALLLEWIPSAALELLWFSSLQGDKDIEAVWKEFGQTPLGLIRTNGLKAVEALKGDEISQSRVSLPNGERARDEVSSTASFS